MSLALLTLGLLAASPAQAQQYPGGGGSGGGYPGSGTPAIFNYGLKPNYLPSGPVPGWGASFFMPGSGPPVTVT